MDTAEVIHISSLSLLKVRLVASRIIEYLLPPSLLHLPFDNDFISVLCSPPLSRC